MCYILNVRRCGAALLNVAWEVMMTDLDKARQAKHSHITFRVPAAEYDQIHAAAKSCGMSMGAFVKEAIRNHLAGNGHVIGSASAGVARATLQHFRNTLFAWISDEPGHAHSHPIRSAFDNLIIAIDAILPAGHDNG